MRCPACGCGEADELGKLGLLYWWRCIACGWDYTEDPDENSGFRVFEAEHEAP